MELRVSVCCRDPVVGLEGWGAIGHSCDPERLRQWLGRRGSACGTGDVALGPTRRGLVSQAGRPTPARSGSVGGQGVGIAK